ncbi:hypothetical protein HG536_0G00790 [Torulaspora globosa]|uniref:MADS-box domain-containing protein n=1 Tax=Torulaspora globosa TaxID=48254 RepID=A0A7G3ZL36_9SACH|nr:uncharacterized protein HG536_0G00790 [Torulaspora globosa]QLL34222.1 hypothetical protein HG536_0G00790 [Torulaspora globosa]
MQNRLSEGYEESPADRTAQGDSCSTTPPSAIEGKTAKRKANIKLIANRTRRHVTFAKRRHGIMKKAYELSVLTGANVMLLILSKSGLVYTFTTPKLEPFVRDEEGKKLIRRCLEDEHL